MLYSFDNHVLDTDRRELRRGADAIAVEPQVFDLLEYLIRNRERVVSRGDVLAAVWGGRIVSESALATRINAARKAVGDTGERQNLIRTIARKGFRFVGEVREDAPESKPSNSGLPRSGMGPTRDATPAPRQEVTFCRTTDGVNIAIASSGSGIPIVKTGTWLTHIEHDWHSELWAPLLTRLSAQFRLVRYDPRGCGLSDWNVDEISFDAFVRDIEAVVDSLGLERFALFGLSQGAAMSVAYAARYPDRVSHLVLSGGFPLGWRKQGNEKEIASREALISLVKDGWGLDNPAFRQVFTTRLFPDATPELMSWFNELQRVSTSPENATRVFRSVGDFDVVDLLPRVAAPTLVLHSRGDAGNPFELGLMLARGIPKARFVEIDSRNHIPLSTEPAWKRYTDEICAFFADAGKSSELR